MNTFRIELRFAPQTHSNAMHLSSMMTCTDLPRVHSNIVIKDAAKRRA